MAARRAQKSRHETGWLVELEAHLLGVGKGVAHAHFRELLEVRAAELVALGLVEVDVGEFHGGGEELRGEGEAVLRAADGDVGAGDHDQLLQLGKVDVDLDAVVGEGGEGERAARRGGEPERNRHIDALALPRVAHQLGAGVAAARELREAPAGRPRQLLPHEHEQAVQRLDGLTADGDLGLIDEVADAVDVVRVGVLSSGRSRAVLVIRAAAELRAAPYFSRATRPWPP